MTLGLKFLLCINGKDFKKLYSDMYFQLQQMYSCETVGKGACLARIGGSKNYSANTMIQC